MKLRMAAHYFDGVFQGDLSVYDAADIDLCRAVSQRTLMDDMVSVLDVHYLLVCTVRAKQDPVTREPLRQPRLCQLRVVAW